MTTPLTVSLEANLDRLQKGFDDAVGMADKAVSQIEDAFTKANPQVPSSLLAIAGGALGGFGIDKFVEAVVKANEKLVELNRAAQQLVTTTDRLQAFQFAFATKGVSGDATVKGLTEMASRLNDAQRSENDLTKILDANNQKYKDRNGQLISIDQLLDISANLIRNAGTELDKIKIAEKLGVPKEFIPALEKGADAFNELAARAFETGNIISRETIAKAAEFDSQWKIHTANWATNFKAQIGEILPLLNQIINFGIDFAKGVGDGISVLTTLGKAASQGVEDLDQAQLRVLLRFSQDQGWDEMVARVKARIEELGQAQRDAILGQIPRITVPVPVNPNPTKFPSSEDKPDKNAFTRQIDQLEKLTARYDADTEAIGKNAGEHEKLRAEAALTEALLRAGIEINDEYARKIDAVAQAAGAAAQRYAEANQKFQQQQDLIRFGGNQIIDILDGIRTGSLNASQALVQLGNTLIKAVEQAALLGTGPLAGLLGTAAAAGSGGTGGLLGALFGGARAGGGPVEAGKAYLVNENTPNSEIFVPGANGVIVPAPVKAGSSGGITVNVTSSPVFQAGMTPTDIAAIDARLRENNLQLQSDIIRGVRQGLHNDSTFLG